MKIIFCSEMYRNYYLKYKHGTHMILALHLKNSRKLSDGVTDKRFLLFAIAIDLDGRQGRYVFCACEIRLCICIYSEKMNGFVPIFARQQCVFEIF